MALVQWTEKLYAGMHLWQNQKMSEICVWSTAASKIGDFE